MSAFDEVIDRLTEAGLKTSQAQELVWDAESAHRAQVLTEAADDLQRYVDTEWSGPDRATARRVWWLPRIERLRDLAATGKDTSDGSQPPAGESTQATPDFFQVGHGYTHRDGSDFKCVAITTHPLTGEPRALGWIIRNGWHDAGALDPDDWAHAYDGCEPPTGGETS